MADARTGLLTGKGKKEAKKDRKDEAKKTKDAEKKTKAEVKKMTKTTEKVLGAMEEKGEKARSQLKKPKSTKKWDEKKIADAEAHFKKVKGGHMLRLANDAKPVMVVQHKIDLDAARRQVREEAGGRKKSMPTGVASVKAFERTGGKEFEPKHIVKGYNADKQKGTSVHVSKDTKAHTAATKYKAYHHYPVKD